MASTNPAPPPGQWAPPSPQPIHQGTPQGGVPIQLLDRAVDALVKLGLTQGAESVRAVLATAVNPAANEQLVRRVGLTLCAEEYPFRDARRSLQTGTQDLHMVLPNAVLTQWLQRPFSSAFLKPGKSWRPTVEVAQPLPSDAFLQIPDLWQPDGHRPPALCNAPSHELQLTFPKQPPQLYLGHPPPLYDQRENQNWATWEMLRLAFEAAQRQMESSPGASYGTMQRSPEKPRQPGGEYAHSEFRDDLSHGTQTPPMGIAAAPSQDLSPDKVADDNPVREHVRGPRRKSRKRQRSSRAPRRKPVRCEPSTSAGTNKSGSRKPRSSSSSTLRSSSSRQPTISLSSGRSEPPPDRQRPPLFGAPKDRRVQLICRKTSSTSTSCGSKSLQEKCQNSSGTWMDKHSALLPKLKNTLKRITKERSTSRD